MIQIKDKVNKTQIFKELTKIGKKRFEFTCEPDEDLKVFLDGAEALFKLLLIPVVVQRSEQYCECEKPTLGKSISRCGTCDEWFKPLK